MNARHKSPRVFFYVAVLAAVSLYPATMSYAQPNGASGRAGSLGTSGGIAQPQGAGAGGSTAAQGSTFTSGSLSGPGPVNQNRYGGQVATPDDEPIDDTPIDEPVNTPLARPRDKTQGYDQALLSPENDWCADYDAQKLTGKTALEGMNRRRLVAVQHYIAPGFGLHGNPSELSLLSHYQQELAKARPNAELAGTYIGLASAFRMDAERLTEVNKVLCVTTAPRQIKKILHAARRAYKKP